MPKSPGFIPLASSSVVFNCYHMSLVIVVSMIADEILVKRCATIFNSENVSFVDLWKFSITL
jgi:hypothetical protein